MSTKALVMSLVVLAALALTAIVLMKTAPTAGSAAPGEVVDGLIPGLDPTRLEWIELERPDGRVERIERIGAGGWDFVDSSGSRWPAALPAGVARALGLLAQVPADPELSFASETEVRIRFGMDAPRPLELEIARAGLGGRRLARGPGQSIAMIDGAVIGPLIQPGPGAWRSRAAAPRVRQSSRIEIRSRDSIVRLSKLGGRWSMLAPAEARADTRAVRALLDALAQIQILEFIDDGSADFASTGGGSARMVVEYEIDERVATQSGDVRVSTMHQTLSIGGPASADGRRLLGRAGGSRSTDMLVGAEAVSRISTAARNYLEPTICDIEASDIFGFRIASALDGSSRTLRREANGWTETTSSGPTRTGNEEAILQLLGFITAEEGEADILESPADLRVALEIEILDLADEVAVRIEAGYTPDGELAFRSGNLLIRFDEGRAPPILRMPPKTSVPPGE